MRRTLSRLKWNLRTLPSRFLQWAEDVELQMLSGRFNKINETAQRKLPPHSYNYLDDYIQRFLNSKSHQGVTPNEQLMLVCGPELIGKTALIRKNLRQFAQRKPQTAVKIRRGDQSYVDSPFLDIFTNMEESMRAPDSQHFLKVELDFEHNSDLTFQAFLFAFQEETLKTILRVVADIERTGAELLSEDILIDILLEGKSPEYVLMYFKDHLASVVNDTALQLADETTNEQLTEFLEQTKSVMIEREHIKTFIKKAFEILTRERTSPLQTQLRLCLSVCAQIEYQHRPKQFTKGYYRSGVESTDFLLDVLNFLGGFHPLCLKQLHRRLNSPEQVASSNYILSGNHIDCVVVLFNLQCLDCYEHLDFLNWFDHVILRVHNPSLLRTHVPFILEIGETQRARDIIALGHLGFDSPTVLEVFGYRYTTLTDMNVSSIFNQKELRWLWPSLGMHPTTWKKAIEKLASGEIEWPDIRNTEWLKDPKRNIAVRAKLNKSFTSERTRSILDEGLLRWRTAQQLQALIRSKGMICYDYDFVDIEIVDDPVQRALSDVQLTSACYYYDTYHLAYLTDLWELVRYHRELTSHGWLDYLRYRWWKLWTHPVSRQNLVLRPKVVLKMEKRYEAYPHRRRTFPIQEYYVPKERFRLEAINDYVIE